MAPSIPLEIRGHTIDGHFIGLILALNGSSDRAMKMMEADIHITGIVQGVGFRPFVYRVARMSGLTGYVLNLGDAGVRVIVQGDKEAISEFVSTVKNNPPSISRIQSLEVEWSRPKRLYNSFEIKKSSEERSVDAVPIIPPDIAICQDCIEDLNNPSSRWFEYPFTSCAACGPRFSTITDLPYDRPNTTMIDFPLCDTCNTGYTDPLDRRYHAQTTACDKCGPQYTILGRNGSVLSEKNPIKMAAGFIDAGFILAVQGITGTHICTATSSGEPIRILRERKARLQRPFAIMVRDLKTIEAFGHLGSMERDLLESWRRPIVLVKKKTAVSSVIPDEVLNLIAPGLDTIGVMLPYAPAHHLLFKYTDESALVMTSANPSGIPMYVDTERIVGELRSIVDYSLVHDRVIHQRADDSVIRMVGPKSPVFIRRARGYVPEPLMFEGVWKDLKILGVGPEEKATASIHSNNRIYMTQHIGDTNVVESMSFLREAIDHMLHLLDINRLDAIACDLHPEFLSTEYAEALATSHDVSLHRIPHHHAHLAAIAVDHGIKSDTSIVCITADGYGYGTDSSGWGGEILVGNMADSQRKGGLKRQSYSGGDLSARYAVRAVHGILGKVLSEDDFLEKFGGASIGDTLTLTSKTMNILSSSTQGGIGALESSSAGRFLDAAAMLLEICSENSYDAECPMKLESTARANDLRIDPVFIEGDYGILLDTTRSLEDLLNLKESGYSVPDLAYAIQHHLGWSLADIACRVAASEGIRVVGFSGGVALNRIVTQAMSNCVKNHGLDFLIHRSIPPGDGGVSVGQVASAAVRECQ